MKTSIAVLAAKKPVEVKQPEPEPQELVTLDPEPLVLLDGDDSAKLANEPDSPM